MSAGPVMNVVLAAMLGVMVPVVAIGMLAPSLEAGRTTPNFRGRPVFAGLGIAWLVWAGAAIIGGVAASSLGGQSLLGLLTVAGLLALVAFALGLVDDAYGTSADRGFRGHLKAAARGRLTTGGMKLLGVSLASYVAALLVATARANSGDPTPRVLLVALPAGAAIALTANFVNLTDLRPGRALKVYTVLAAAGVVSVVFGLDEVSGSKGWALAADAVALALYLIGPVVATWRFDLGERGMMGDAGANAAGAVAGLLIVAGLPPVGLALYLAAVLALNLASERFSFSRIIEGSKALAALDMLGRLPLETDSAPRTQVGGHAGGNAE